MLHGARDWYEQEDMRRFGWTLPPKGTRTPRTSPGSLPGGTDAGSARGADADMEALDEMARTAEAATAGCMADENCQVGQPSRAAPPPPRPPKSPDLDPDPDPDPGS